MNTKLTLKLDKAVIEEAKVYAYKKQQSLSSLVEQYFRFLTASRDPESDSPEISPTIKQLSGILFPPLNLEKNKEEYVDFLEEKYSR